MKNFIIFLVSIALFSCQSNKETPESGINTTGTSVNSNTHLQEPAPIDTPGIAGIIEIPEILTLAIKDSAVKEEIGFKMGKNYSVIEAEMNELGLSNNQMPPGALYYNNNANNFVFECVIPINKMPAKQPRQSKVVILEATRAVVYNYYGTYDKMSAAYNELKKYLTDHHLEQSGVAREFYLSDPTVEKDPAKWLSKIYIPVK